MKDKLDGIEFVVLKQIHNKYVELGSLNKTAKWANKKYRLDINRHHLSYKFHLMGWHVNSPNGQPDKVWRDTSTFTHTYGAFAAAVVKQAWEDLLDPPTRIAYLSACAFVGTPFYQSCFGTLMMGVEAFKHSLDTDTLPGDITAEDILTGKSIYERNYEFWCAF